jgi:hypothetical protein
MGEATPSRANEPTGYTRIMSGVALLAMKAGRDVHVANGSAPVIKRNKARDIYDLEMYATRPLGQAAHPPTRGAEAPAGGRYLRSRAPHEEI